MCVCLESQQPEALIAVLSFTGKKKIQKEGNLDKVNDILCEKKGLLFYSLPNIWL